MAEEITQNSPSASPSSPATPVSGGGKKKKIIIGIIVLALIAGGLYWAMKVSKGTPEEQAAAEVASLVASVGNLLVLPTGEEPTVATVNDPEALKDQQFFANAKEGDKVLIYVGKRQAILYRPSENKLIEVAPLTFDDTAVQQ